MKNVFSLDVFAGRSVLDDPLQKYKFRLTVPGMPNGAGFSKCSGMTDEVDVIEYCEGMWTHVHRIPGRDKVEPITLERGAYASKDAEYLLYNVRTNPNMRGTMLIEIANKYGTIQRSYSLAEAWVSKVELPDLDALSGDIAIEKMTVQYEYVIGGGGNTFGIDTGITSSTIAQT